MAYPLLPTLAEIRQSVLDRCGLASTGNIQRNIKSVLDEKIRSAEEQLYELYPWLRNFVETTITLFDDETDYEIPDDLDPGYLDALAARRISDQKVYPLEPGIRLGETNILGTSAGCPVRYEFIDQILRISPKPDITRYDVLVLQYTQRPTGLVNDTDRTAIHGEAMKMFSEILVKEHFGGVDTTGLSNRFDLFIQNLRRHQSDGSGWQMGGHQSAVTRTQPRNRFAHNPGQGWQDWHPW